MEPGSQPMSGLMNLSKNKMNNYIAIKADGAYLFLDISKKSDIVNHPCGILWFNQGIYGWILKEIVENAIYYEKTQWNLAQSEFKDAGTLKFYWNQTIPVPQEIGKILIEKKQFNN